MSALRPSSQAADIAGIGAQQSYIRVPWSVRVCVHSEVPAVLCAPPARSCCACPRCPSRRAGGTQRTKSAHQLLHRVSLFKEAGANRPFKERDTCISQTHSGWHVDWGFFGAGEAVVRPLCQHASLQTGGGEQGVSGVFKRASAGKNACGRAAKARHSGECARPMVKPYCY